MTAAFPLTRSIDRLSQPVCEVEETQSPDDADDQNDVDDSYPPDRLFSEILSGDGGDGMDLSLRKVLGSPGMTASAGLLEIILVGHRLRIRGRADVVNPVTAGTVGRKGISAPIRKTVKTIIVRFYLSLRYSKLL